MKYLNSEQTLSSPDKSGQALRDSIKKDNFFLPYLRPAGTTPTEATGGTRHLHKKSRRDGSMVENTWKQPCLSPGGTAK